MLFRVQRETRRPPGAALQRLAREVSGNRRRIYGKAGAMMVAQTKRRMAGGVAPTGDRWMSLSPRTIAAKGHDKPLFHTGDLNRSIQVLALSADNVVVGPTMGAQKKAITMQFGRQRIDGVTFQVPEHTRRAHTRTQAGRVVRVRAHTVRAHARQGSLPPIPARPFLGWAPQSRRGQQDLQQVTDLVITEIRRHDGV